MSVTLEEASLVKDVYGITGTRNTLHNIISLEWYDIWFNCVRPAALETKSLLDALRVHGLRLENAKKNVGKVGIIFRRVCNCCHYQSFTKLIY
jgi:hypothetical protein